MKVQEGCLLRCSYCIIPTVRPQMSSRPAAEILDEVRRLIDHGYQEIVLTGIHLGHYGVDFNRHRPKAEWQRLSHLVEQMVELPGDFRVRLSSIEATEVTRELIDVMAEHPRRVCPHLHVCLQSGSDAVLRRMKRRWGAKRFVDRCHKVMESLDRPALTTDIIVGFPGETEADFEATCRVAREVGFSKIHIFPFSPRRTTPAAEMPDQVVPQVKAERVQRLAELEAELRAQYFQSLLGQRLDVLIESENSDASFGSNRASWLGTACRYAPVEVQAPAGSNPPAVGSIVTVRAQAAAADRIHAQIDG